MRTVNQAELSIISGGCNECQIDNDAVYNTMFQYTGTGAAIGFGLTLAPLVYVGKFDGLSASVVAMATLVGVQLGAISSLFPLMVYRDSYVKQQ